MLWNSKTDEYQFLSKEAAEALNQYKVVETEIHEMCESCKAKSSKAVAQAWET